MHAAPGNQGHLAHGYADLRDQAIRAGVGFG
jgi:hypothetical protein